MKPPKILVLAAGEGTRMKSALPKVLHEAAGDSLLGHVLRAARPLGGKVGVVVGNGAELVRERFKDCSFFFQKKRLGSGHAVMAAGSWLKGGGDVVVLCGDAPLVRPETLKELLRTHRAEKNAATLLTARVEKPAGYGRIVRDSGGKPWGIVEERDAAEEVRAIDEINSGTYVFQCGDLLRALRKVRPDNSKGEYYVTDVIALLVKESRPVGALCVEGGEEALGVNHRGELAQADKILRRRTLERLMAEGVSVTDPDTTYVGPDVKAGRDSVIRPFTFLLGKTVLGEGAKVGPYAHVEDCRIGAGADVRASFALGSTVGEGARVGPYAHLRPGTRIGAQARVGNFVELKKADLGRGAKANHLSYVGDASVGADANIGAGVITCNYDGFQKHRTAIGAGAFIGSNANLVAPVRVGAGAIVGAGSTIVKDVPAEALGIARSLQTVKKGWAKRKRTELRRGSGRKK
jgi:bifunctional UDP-N-acetylglucosamine pyrophosphorylase / glucosamine-1-phosphate N-acetyltransferase